MRSVPTIVAREYLQRVRTKTFVIGTLAAPVLFLGFVAFTAWMGTRDSGRETRIAVVDHTGVLFEGIASRLDEAGYDVDDVRPAGRDEALARIEAGELTGMIEVDDETLARGVSVYRGKDSPSTLRRLTLRQLVVQAALERRLELAGDPGLVVLLGGGEMEVALLGEDVPGGREVGVVLGYAGGMILYIALLVYGSLVLRAVLEEKTGRIAEVLLSSIRPWELMLGKILGVGAVGLTQLLVWALSGALILAVGVGALMPMAGDSDLLARLPEILPGPGLLVFFVTCFLFGYFIYSSLFAAVGAMCSTEEEAQQLQMPVVILVLAPFLLIAPIMDAPESGFAQGMSLFPLFSPILMFARVAAGAAPAWEAIVSIVGMALALFGVAWVAGRIYRVGILMQGKRPTLPELWRWVRHAG